MFVITNKGSQEADESLPGGLRPCLGALGHHRADGEPHRVPAPRGHESLPEPLPAGTPRRSTGYRDSSAGGCLRWASYPLAGLRFRRWIRSAPSNSGGGDRPHRRATGPSVHGGGGREHARHPRGDRPRAAFPGAGPHSRAPGGLLTVGRPRPSPSSGRCRKFSRPSTRSAYHAARRRDRRRRNQRVGNRAGLTRHRRRGHRGPPPGVPAADPFVYVPAVSSPRNGRIGALSCRPARRDRITASTRSLPTAVTFGSLRTFMSSTPMVAGTGSTIAFDDGTVIDHIDWSEDSGHS